MGGIIFHWYGLVIGIAVVLWWSLVERLEPKMMRYIPMGLFLAFVGARIYHVWEYWSYYQHESWWSVFLIWQGGLSIWGALILGGGYLVYSAKEMMWAAVTALPLAQAIGRVGNGVNAEFTNQVMGIPWWGMEAILDLVLFVVIWVIPKNLRVGSYLLGYGLIRLVLEPYR